MSLPDLTTFEGMRAFWLAHQEQAADERRSGAALMACKDISTEGLEELAARNLTLEFALLASITVENDRARDRKTVEILTEHFEKEKGGH